MRTRVDDRLRREARTYRLKFTCEACVHFDPDQRRCSHCYPHRQHCGVDLERVQELSFCKLFELA